MKTTLRNTLYLGSTVVALVASVPLAWLAIILLPMITLLMVPIFLGMVLVSIVRAKPIFPGFLEKRKKLLIVDDDTGFAETLASSLRRMQIQVDVVTRPYAALKKIYQTGYDLIILDESMPRIKGSELLGKLNERAGRWITAGRMRPQPVMVVFCSSSDCSYLKGGNSTAPFRVVDTMRKTSLAQIIRRIQPLAAAC